MSAKPWFAWYPADHRAKTAHLTYVEAEAYRRLIEAYYERRGPLPDDQVALCRLASAQDPAEKAAIRKVSLEFFTAADGKLSHKRCDEEIARQAGFTARQSAKGRAGAEARWSNRGHGTGIGTGIGTGNGTGNAPDMAQAMAQAMRGQWPDDGLPQSQLHVRQNLKSKALSGKARRSIPAKAEKEKIDPSAAKQILAYLNEKTGRRYQANSVNLGFIEARLREGATVLQCRMVIEKKLTDWLGDDKMAPYLRPATLFNATKFAQYQGEIDKSAPTFLDDPPLFAQAWRAYPNRSGNNPRHDARQAWAHRIGEGCDPEAMLAGTLRYADWCRANGKIGTEYVLQGAIFFGSSRPFEQSFAVAADLSKPNVDPRCIFIDPKTGARCPESGTTRVQAFGSNGSAELIACVCNEHYLPPVTLKGEIRHAPETSAMIDRYERALVQAGET